MLWLVGCFKVLEFLRVNRTLSTFILIIQGMLTKISGFLIVFAAVLMGFTGLVCTCTWFARPFART